MERLIARKRVIDLLDLASNSRASPRNGPVVTANETPPLLKEIGSPARALLVLSVVSSPESTPHPGCASIVSPRSSTNTSPAFVCWL